MNNSRNDLLLRGYLASERTGLAIDRTILSYIRTSMTIVVVGISLIKLFNEKYLNLVGYLLVIISIILIVVGFYRSYRLKEKLKGIFR